MLNQFETFFAQPKLQAITLSLFLACLFFMVPFLQRKALAKLNARQKELYDPIAKDIWLQVCLLFVGVVIYSLLAFVRSDLSFVSGDALPFVSLIGSLCAFWNIRRANRSVKNASQGMNKQRAARLSDVDEMNLKAYSAGFLSFLYGVAAVFLVLLVPEELPKWLWFANFFVTAIAIRALSWSISVLAVATEYERNPKMGRPNHSAKRAA
jgi:hypothetical protein